MGYNSTVFTSITRNSNFQSLHDEDFVERCQRIGQLLELYNTYVGEPRFGAFTPSRGLPRLHGQRKEYLDPMLDKASKVAQELKGLTEGMSKKSGTLLNEHRSQYK